MHCLVASIPMKYRIVFLFPFFLFQTLCAQQQPLDDAVASFFRQYAVEGYHPHDPMRMDSLKVDAELHELSIYANEPFCSQPFTPQGVRRIYAGLQRALPAPYNTYHIQVYNKKGFLIEDLIPNILRDDNQDADRLWRSVDYTGLPWVRNTSLPYQVTEGLQNRHLFVWPSHGRYFKNGGWRWQRPYLYGTTEDLFTQSFVFPYLIPMLEKAGAVVATPRERDTQTQEAVVDNDFPERQGSYLETFAEDARWTSSPDSAGFGMPATLLNDSIFPFRQGTWRMVPALARKSRLASATWQPRIPRAGKYAVYVSYASRPNSVPDARYTVYHKGGRTHVQVNQQMGGGTWVYLGTFDFDEGSSPRGRVVLTNQSNYRGVVTADAVRFGGGVGQTERGLAGTSGLPRFLEAARYYAQWAGIPDTLFNTEQGTNDYADDLRVRSNMLNYLSGGSVYVPDWKGCRVPFELSLALHSDAGVSTDRSVYGSLGISTTQDGDGNTHYASGLSRQASSDFARLLLTGLSADLSRNFQTGWTQREHWDRNYAETRMPGVPSAILEMLSHQNFTDMHYGHDPNFKFALARSVYKTILRFVNYSHGQKKFSVQPLPPRCFAAELSDDGTSVKLSWKQTVDSLCDNARPTGYVVYTQTDGEGFDNGLAVGNHESYEMPVMPDKIYAFRVTAVNAGGESFPSETLAVRQASGSNRRVLIVNGFDRLSGPATVNTPDSLGFDFSLDMGVPYISTTALAGKQVEFNPLAPHVDGPGGLGYSGREWMGREIAGNTFDYPLCHGKAMAAGGGYSFCSVSCEAFEQNKLKIGDYAVIDYIAGLQADKPYNLLPYKTFPSAVRQKLTDYLRHGGALLVSGSYIGSDNQRRAEERKFLEEVLKCRYDGSAYTDSTDYVNGLNLQFLISRQPNAKQYAVQAPDALQPTHPNAFCAFAYGGGQGAGVAYRGSDYRVITMGFPFESITDETVRGKAMGAMLKFLVE